jgi:hypothetical protein
MWTKQLADELSEHLEQATWSKKDDLLQGKTEKWLFTAFPMGMDSRRTCEVMAMGRIGIIRLPPELAERGIKLAKEKTA